jgi:hypothetical protein
MLSVFGSNYSWEQLFSLTMTDASGATICLSDERLEERVRIVAIKIKPDIKIVNFRVKIC